MCGLGRLCAGLLQCLLDRPVDVPGGFAKVFHSALVIGAPEILHGVPEVEAHVLDHLDALDGAAALAARRQRRVMLRVVDCVAHAIPTTGGCISATLTAQYWEEE